MDNENMNEEDNIVTLIDEETGEEIDFIYADRFEINGSAYAVLLTDVEKEEDIEMVIMEEIEEGDDILLQSLDEDKEDIIYDYYDKLCEELFEDEDESEE